MLNGGLSVDKLSILKIDRDCFVDSAWIRNYAFVIVTICKMFDVTVEWIKATRSRKKGNHFYVKVRPALEPNFCNQLCYLLGDDALRVDRNRARIEAGFNAWSKLFERPNARLRAI